MQRHLILRYDQHPLVAVTELFQWGFRGINFHLRDYRQYTWEELGTQVYIVQREELDDLLSLDYEKIVLNKKKNHVNGICIEIQVASVRREKPVSVIREDLFIGLKVTRKGNFGVKRENIELMLKEMVT